MFRKTCYGVALLAALICTTAARAGDEPTLHEVYAAAEAGRFNDAQSMMDKVLKDHPGSAKAHFVEAELLAKQGRLANASAELTTAEHLAPGLPFAKPEAVRNLQQRLAATHNGPSSAGSVHSTAAVQSGGLSWSALLLGGGIIATFIYFARALLARRTAPMYAPGGAAGYTGPAGIPNNAPLPPTGSGLGSNILGGLATGAAVGAGMVAGEALVHHLMDGNRRDGSTVLPPTNDAYLPDDMGGADFGINDSSSWDDNLGGGGDDNW